MNDADIYRKLTRHSAAIRRHEDAMIKAMAIFYGGGRPDLDRRGELVIAHTLANPSRYWHFHNSAATTLAARRMVNNRQRMSARALFDSFRANNTAPGLPLSGGYEWNEAMASFFARLFNRISGSEFFEERESQFDHLNYDELCREIIARQGVTQPNAPTPPSLKTTPTTP